MIEENGIVVLTWQANGQGEQQLLTSKNTFIELPSIINNNNHFFFFMWEMTNRLWTFYIYEWIDWTISTGYVCCRRIPS